jgi:XTP/dITP diphosphohydrolase
LAKLTAVLASENEHKLRELRGLLPEWELDALRGAEYPEETGATFFENAGAKARFARGLVPADVWVLAEDSGLEVAGLGGGPGVRSARYAGPGATDEARRQRLLLELKDTPDGERRARFVCVIALAEPGSDAPQLFTGTCAGRIACTERGGGGFGYDPLFVPDGYEQTFGELPDEVKQRISHRARALAAARDYLHQQLKLPT